ncbi:MAG TPA: prepilin-type N-terminal cleavage/methylation domain-containing protein [Candidatus Acidoferrales bacterium]|jgi:prepilin-type N-terminal cleavage/methylation domain-containing protein|nr:prepilin-type N-terminal cleavage/methylation domain-containing protein [Candidatus Acidoferrales bacterium]
MKLNRVAKTNRAKQSGFTLVEVMIAIAVMSIGLLAVVGAIATAVASTQSAQEDLIARHKALEAMESIYTARNSQQIPFTSINNTGSGGIFNSGAQPLLCAGPDGLVGTTDDVPCTTFGGTTCPNSGVECWVLPGPDGVLGTADDQTMSLANFTRTITISQVLLSNGTVNDNMIAVSVAVTYTKDGLPPRTYTVNGLISRYN